MQFKLIKGQIYQRFNSVKIFFFALDKQPHDKDSIQLDIQKIHSTIIFLKTFS